MGHTCFAQNSFSSKLLCNAFQEPTLYGMPRVRPRTQPCADACCLPSQQQPLPTTQASEQRKELLQAPLLAFEVIAAFSEFVMVLQFRPACALLHTRSSIMLILDLRRWLVQQ